MQRQTWPSKASYFRHYCHFLSTSTLTYESHLCRHLLIHIRVRCYLINSVLLSSTKTGTSCCVKGPVSSGANTCARTHGAVTAFNPHKTRILWKRSTKNEHEGIKRCLQIQPVEGECGQEPRRRVLTACRCPARPVLLRSAERRMADTAAICRKVTLTRKHFRINRSFLLRRPFLITSLSTPGIFCQHFQLKVMSIFFLSVFLWCYYKYSQFLRWVWKIFFGASDV